MLGHTVQCSPSQPLLVRNDQCLMFRELLQVHAPPSVILPFLYYTDVDVPTITTITPGKNSISLGWSPSEGSPLSYTVTWTGSGVTSSVVLSPTARNYTIGGLDSNNAYSGTVEVYSLANHATVSWGAHTLPQGERVCISVSCMICFCSNTACIKT